MNKNCAFTICTKSYIGLAEILQKSLYKNCKSIEFYIFIADEIDDGISLPDNAYVIKDLDIFTEKKWIELSFKYNVTEFCTCLKPFVCKWIFENKEVNKVFYMDPDLFFFNDAQPLLDGLDNSLIELTPHFVTFPQNRYSNYFEDEIRYSGIFNLGFLGLKKDKKVFSMLDWWGNNLLDKCFLDGATFQFTDQKWMDFIPVYFNIDEINIIRDLGWNIAPWNYFERKSIIENNTVYIVNRNDESQNRKYKLIFAHFSGFDYKALIDEQIIQKNSGHENEFSDADTLLQFYIENLKQNKNLLLENLKRKYNYASYSNGVTIDKFHRRVYRAFLLTNLKKIDNPYNVNGKFYNNLAKYHMLSVKKNSIETLKNDDSYVTRKLEKVNKLFRFIYKVIGYNRYLTFIRFMHRYTKFENQIFILDKNNIVWL